MTSPQVSVIIPAYNQGPYVGEAIQSVIDQTFTAWEVIIVDDGSTDETASVVQSFQDPRVQYIYQENRGLPGARNTGIAASTGEYFAFLDADDLYRSNKLEAHLRHFEQQPLLGLSYASRLEVDGGGEPIWMIRAPGQAGLKDLVLGFPFTINDLLVRRSWVDEVGGFDEKFRLHSEDRDFYVRLALAGCRFGRVNTFVANRRIHPRRFFSRIPERIEVMALALETAFADPRCPEDVRAVRNQAYGRMYLNWVFQELIQDETEAGQQHLRQAADLQPDLFGDHGRAFLRHLAWYSVRDGSDHEEPVRKVLASLPDEMAQQLQPVEERQVWTLARGYLLRGARAILWSRLGEGRDFFSKASQLGGRFDDSLLNDVAGQLSSYEQIAGHAAGRQAFDALEPFLVESATQAQVRRIKSRFSLNRAFHFYRRNQYRRALSELGWVLRSDPAHLADRGVLSMLARSLVGIVR